MMAVASFMVLEWICFLRKERNFVLVKTALDVEINCEQTSCGRRQRAAFCTMFNYLFVLLFVHFIVSCNFRSKLLISESLFSLESNEALVFSVNIQISLFVGALATFYWLKKSFLT